MYNMYLLFIIICLCYIYIYSMYYTIIWSTHWSSNINQLIIGIDVNPSLIVWSTNWLLELISFHHLLYDRPIDIGIHLTNWCLIYIYIWFVVDVPLWKMMEFVSWDDDIPNWMEKSNSCSKPPTRYNDGIEWDIFSQYSHSYPNS